MVEEPHVIGDLFCMHSCAGCWLSSSRSVRREQSKERNCSSELLCSSFGYYWILRNLFHAMLVQRLKICAKLSAFYPSQHLWASRGCFWFYRWKIYTLYTSVFHFCQTQTPIITTQLWGGEARVCLWTRQIEREWWRYVVSLMAQFGFCLESGLMFSLLSKYLHCLPS